MKTDKLLAKLGQDTIDEMDKMSEVDLKQVIFDANSAMQTVKDELDANEVYQQIKENLKAITQGKRDVDSRQKARIEYALACISKFGQTAN